MNEAAGRVACAICGAAAARRYAGHAGYVAGSVFDIHHCAGCGAAFALPRGDAAYVYQLIYSHAERTPGYSRYSQYAGRIGSESNPLAFLAGSEDVYWGAADALRQRRAEGLACRRVLDVGSGLGYFTHALRQAGVQAEGWDVSPVAVEEARRRFGDHFRCAPLDAADRGGGAELHDIVFALEVIEHAPDPGRFLADVSRLVAPGGWVVLTTPNRSLYPEWTLWETDLPPVHFWWLGEASVGHLARKGGWRFRLVDFTAFHARRPGVYKARQPRYRPTRTPMFTAEGRLVREAPLPPADPPSRLRAAVRATGLMPYLRPVRDRLLGRRRCGARGLTLCAILEKPA